MYYTIGVTSYPAATYWNPYYSVEGIDVISQGNRYLEFTANTPTWAALPIVRTASCQFNSGKYYSEHTMTYNANSNLTQFGVIQQASEYAPSEGFVTRLGTVTHKGASFRLSDGNGADSAIGWVNISTSDTMMIATDFTNRKMWVGRNGTWFNSGNPAAGTNPQINQPASWDSSLKYGYYAYAIGASDWKFLSNFGQSPFSYSVPSGFYPGMPAILPSESNRFWRFHNFQWSGMNGSDLLFAGLDVSAGGTSKTLNGHWIVTRPNNTFGTPTHFRAWDTDLATELSWPNDYPNFNTTDQSEGGAAKIAFAFVCDFGDGTAVALDGIRLGCKTGGTSSQFPTSVDVQKSPDGVTWTDVATCTFTYPGASAWTSIQSF